MAIRFVLKTSGVYLSSDVSFTLVTDHQVLYYAFIKKETHGYLARWMHLLAKYDFDIEYPPGTANKASDYLSKMHVGEEKEGSKSEFSNYEMVAAAV